MPLTPYRQITIDSSDGITLFLRDYGDAMAARPVVCLHGLTRNSADFEPLAEHLSKQGQRVICPDFRGRGLSSYDPNFMNYVPPIYARDVIECLTALNVEQAVFVGTSLGGIVTQVLALARPDLLAGVVLNDIGPELVPAGLIRIMGYAGKQADPANWDEATAQIQTLNSAFFPRLDQAAWSKVARRMFIEKTTGGLRPAYDPRIGDALHNAPQAVDMWALFSGLNAIPALVLRGALSDLLSAEIVERMIAAKPDLEAVCIPDQGHAPLLDEPVALAAIDRFLARVAAVAG